MVASAPADDPPSCQRALEESRRHADRLHALWRTLTRREIDEEQRFRAMLSLAARELDMELAVIGEFDGDFTARYVHDTLGLLPEGSVLAVSDTLCQHVYLSREPLLIGDLSAHPVFNEHPLVATAGLTVYAGMPIWVEDKVDAVLAFLRHAPLSQGFTPADVVFMELLSAWLGLHFAQRQHRHMLERYALTDPMTQLLNRRAAENRLQQEQARVRRHGEAYALAMIDIDRFKMVNDRYGHAVGDEVLRAVAARIEAGLREEDWVARWGGEEFLVFLRDIDHREAIFVMERLAAKVKATAVATEAGELNLTLSIGVALSDALDTPCDAVVEAADQSLYRAKANGRDRVELRGGENLLLPAREIRRAVRDGRLAMATQLIHDLATGEAVADEALARVRMDDGGVLAASEFIEAAEGLGLMTEIDRFITRRAMSRCASRLGSGLLGADFAHFINLSPQFLARRDLVEEMLGNAMVYCQTCGVNFGPIKPVVFEITERQFLSNLDTLEADLKPLLDFGFRLALDDFGSGYSSFLYLARLPISFLKIEGRLVGNVRQQRKSAAIVESLADFARREGIVTVAECVEDAETARMLRDMGVHLAQGWHFSYPQLEEDQE